MQLGRTSIALSLGLLAVACAAGCTGTLDAGPRAGRGGSTDDPTDPSRPTGPGICAPEVGTIRARRLTASEHAAIVLDVLGVTVADGALPADEVTAGFAANAETAISDAELTTHLALAESIAHDAISGGRVTTCTDAACVERFLDDSGERLYRRSLSTDERSALIARASAWRASEGAPRAMEMLIATLLVSPRFLYVIESATGAPREDGALRLDGPSLASRLSFLLTGRGPDRALLDAAEAGELDTDEGLATHASRLVDDAAASAATAAFLAEWLHVSSVHDESKAVHTSGAVWSDEIARSMERDTELVLAEIVATEGGLPELLGSNVAYVDATIAPLYGVTAPPAGETVRAELPTRRASSRIPRCSRVVPTRARRAGRCEASSSTRRCCARACPARPRASISPRCRRAVASITRCAAAAIAAWSPSARASIASMRGASRAAPPAAASS